MRKTTTTIAVLVILVSMVLVGFGGTQVGAETGSIQAYWRMDTGSGNIAFDSSDSTNDGVLSGGMFENALKFDGVDDNVDVPHSSSLDITGDLTLEAWIKPSSISYSAQGEIIGKWAAGDASFYFALRNGEIQMRISSTGSDYYNIEETSSADLNIDTWYHLVGVYDSSAQDIKIYINGVEESTTVTGTIPSSIHSGTDNVKIGGWSPGYYFHGLIDEVRIYSRALSGTEASEHYQGTFSDESNLAGLWHFDYEAGSTASDASVNSNDGTINGATYSTTPPIWVDGKYGKGLHFDGVDDIVTVKHDSTLTLSSAFTIEAWINLDTDSTNSLQYIISKDVSTGVPFSNYNLLTFNGKPALFQKGLTIGAATQGTAYSDDGGGGIVGETIVGKGVWHHIASVYTGSELKIYLDGVLDGACAASGAPNSNTEDVWIGSRKSATYGQGMFYGIIDEVRIWSKALTSCQLQLSMDGKLEILPIAGVVIYQSSYHDLIDGEEVTICIISDYEIDYVELNPNRGATPKKTSGSISEEDDIGYTSNSATFNVFQVSEKPCKTLHVWVHLTSGEHIGVNLHFER